MQNQIGQWIFRVTGNLGGEQIQEISKLIEQQAIRTVVDGMFRFEQTNEALGYLESGIAMGK